MNHTESVALIRARAWDSAHVTEVEVHTSFPGTKGLYPQYAQVVEHMQQIQKHGKSN